MSDGNPRILDRDDVEIFRYKLRRASEAGKVDYQNLDGFGQPQAYLARFSSYEIMIEKESAGGFYLEVRSDGVCARTEHGRRWLVLDSLYDDFASRTESAKLPDYRPIELVALLDAWKNE